MISEIKFSETLPIPRRNIAEYLGLEFDPSTLEVSFQGQKIGRFLKDDNGLIIWGNDDISSEIVKRADKLTSLKKIT